MKSLLALLFVGTTLLAESSSPDPMPEIRAYFLGDNRPVDYNKAIELAEQAAAQGHAEALQMLGFCYLKGLGVPVDESKAADYYRRAAEAGSPKGQLNYGLMLRKGKGVEKDSASGLEWMEKAARQDFPEGQLILGQLYFLGDDDLTPDPAKAFPLLEPLAHAGQAKAQNILGIMYRDAQGVNRNPVFAAEWFRRAAQQGEPKAQSNLAHLLAPESASSPVRTEALTWLLISMGQGELTAKKTYQELLPTLPPELLAEAQSRAGEFKPVPESPSTEE
jgi:TPR repeat protein